MTLNSRVECRGEERRGEGSESTLIFSKSDTLVLITPQQQHNYDDYRIRIEHAAINKALGTNSTSTILRAVVKCNKQYEKHSFHHVAACTLQCETAQTVNKKSKAKLCTQT